MTKDPHTEAQKYSSEAALRSQLKDPAAIDLYAKAAALEKLALGGLSKTALRTRGILSVSYTSLLYKARMFAEAEFAIYQCLSDPEMPDHARVQHRELLEVVGDELLLKKHGIRYTGQEFLLSLRGGLIGTGSAPLEVAIDTIKKFTSLVNRVLEWKGKFPFRTTGQMPTEVASLLQARVAQPMSGSYRFLVRLTEPEETLFSAKIVEPADVAGSVITSINYAVLGKIEPLRELIPDHDYRDAVLKLVRNIVPDGKSVRELEVSHVSPTNRETVYFDKRARDYINTALRTGRPESDSETIKFQGVLRALHLDKNWLVVVTDKGEHKRFATDKNVLDDIVGPMVSNAVPVTATERGTKVRLIDIQLAEDQ